ncbi:MAG TPA: hypothetical protein VGA37_09015 [Gemmatimonadales bacterium]
MKKLPITVTMLLAVLAVLLVAPAVSGRTGSQATASSATQAFERLRSLAGAWTFRDSLEQGSVSARPLTVTGTVSYALVSNGTTIQETVNGPDHDTAEMISMIRVDGDRLVLDHYCSAGNQPRLVSRGLEGNQVRFVFESGTGLASSGTGHIHAATFTFLPAGGFESHWTWLEPGNTHTAVRQHAVTP